MGFFRRFPYAIGILAALGLLVHLEENVRGRRAWEAWKAAQEAAGQAYALPGPRPGTVPDRDNFAAAPVLAAGAGRWEEWNACWNRLPNPAPGDFTQGRATDFSALDARNVDLLKDLAPFEEVLGPLAEAARRPSCVFPREPGGVYRPAATGMPSRFLAFMTRVLWLRAEALLHGDRAPEALGDLETILRMSRHLEGQPSLLAHMTGQMQSAVAVQLTWEGLRSRAWTPAQLARLQDALGSVDLLEGFRAGLQGERYAIAQAVREAEALPWYRLGWAGPEPAGRVGRWLRRVPPPLGWTCQAAVAQDRTLARIRAAAGSGSGILGLREADLRPTPAPYRWAGDSLPTHQVRLLQTVASSQARLDQARLACALERFRLARGAYPARLEDLGPSFLGPVPRDRLADRPLGYVRRKGGYQLTATGWQDWDETGRQETPGTLAWTGGQ
jgi:hypothetical protein